MRRFLLIAMVMFTLPMFAQNYTMRLANVYSEDGFEAWDYIYPSEASARITCINELDFLTNNEVIDSLFYDDNGNIIKIATWQKNESGEMIYACYIDYTYDERNLRITRTNYNNFGGNFELGGVYRYSYDEEGKMTEWSLDFGMEDFQKAFIEYDDETGLKLSETCLAYNFSTYQLENLYLLEYEYDENGNAIKEAEYSWSNAEQRWLQEPYVIWEYDEYNNCILEEQRTLAGTTQDRRVYSYDTSILASDVLYYENPEKDWPPLPEKKTNLLKSFEFYAQNDSNELSYVTTYVVDYEVGEFAMTVEEVSFLSSVYPNPAQDYVMVESSEAEYVEVVDMYGRVMFSTEMSETVKVDMSEFASGIYFVKLQANGATSVQKIVKK